MASINVLHFLSALLCALQLSGCQCANIITVQPVSINTTLNSTVYFCCEAAAQYLYFNVNGTLASNVGVMAKGFFGTTTAGVNDIKVGHLEAEAYDYNNNTNITCTAFSQFPLDSNAEASAQTSGIAVLMIQGLLDDVGNLNWTTINCSSVLITWTPPYTLDNVPITGYLVNEIEQSNATNITLSTDPEHSKLYTVSVSAINDVGIGSSNYISFYYPTG
ncbi:PREDICTED: uncharacterized protein LOC109591966 [Amphimedon queenslandica]|uniref:Fibronectin type-III domain-containing protein n=2 Tax=Amphimedon queenslandica TaxID=400682 RepID=A0AAN0K182_AMPQE|nr:PREDICTED: uncharacterized protein LOC109591966 [Amphimedon queenslandica]|eukprot:XP_019863109.1 PREDICTED: uncharacterized protein LOC109591966 [Amphimedon queenslandica]